MTPSGPHILVVVDHTNEGMKFFEVGWATHFDNCIDLFLPRFDAGGC